MKTLLFPITVLRLVAGMTFVCIAGVLALVAQGVGRAGWMLAGDRPAAPAPENVDLELRLRAHAIVAG